jgi:hypothetical protein
MLDALPGADSNLKFERIFSRAPAWLLKFTGIEWDAKDVMVELDLKKLSAPDLTASIRPGTPALMVIDEAAVPSIYWEPREPRLNRQKLASELKEGAEITGVALSNPEPVLSVRTR